MNRSPDAENFKILRGLKIKNLEQIFPHIPIRKSQNNDNQTIKISSSIHTPFFKKIHIPHNRLPGLHKKKTLTRSPDQEKVSHLLKAYLNRHMDYQLDESLGSEKASEKVLNKNLIKEFCVEKIAKTLPYYEKSENSKSTDDYYNNNQNNIITNRDLVKINDYEISDQNFDLIRIVKKECIDIKRDKMLSPVFSCLNIKRIAMNFNKFNSPILIKQEREKESYFDIEKEGNSQEKIIQTVEKKEEIKSRKIIKKPIFLGSLQFEISAYQRFEFFMRSINFSNNITINPTKLPCVYKVYVGKGNNQTLIRKLMKNRFWWSLVDSLEENPNFVWTQIKNKQFLEHLSNLRSSEISLSQTQDSPSSSLNKQAIQHLIYEYSKQNTLVSSSEYSSFLSILKKTAQTKSLSLIKEESSHLVIENSLESSIHNHFEGNFNLGNKKALYHNLRNLFDSLKKSIFDIIPMTFHLRKGLEDSEYQGFLDYFKENKGLWIIKPGENSNRGKGIEITDDISVINRIITSKETHKNGKRKTFILQSYIEKPLLYNKRKFDIRCYMLVTEGNKNMKAFWYKEGYIRTSSKDFSLKNLGNRLVHLTNDAVQKKADDYGKFEPSNKLSFEAFQKYITNEYPSKNFDFTNDVYFKMKEIASDAIKSVFTKLNSNPNSGKVFSFEIFGLDFMLDENFNIWLIEINTNPCLELSSPLLGRIIPNMLENAFRITIDCVFPPPFMNNNFKYQKLLNNYQETNKFELIFDEFTEGKEMKILFDKMPKNDKKVGNLNDEDSEDEEINK